MSLCLAEMWRSFLEMHALRKKIGISRLDINSYSPLNGKQYFYPTSQCFNVKKQTRLSVA